MPDRGKTSPKPPHHPHDKGYRQLLTNKKTFLELLQTFVDEGWVREIKEDDLTLVNKSYVLQDFSDKEADIVYRMRLGGSEIIFYVLLELQSTVDHTMPFRLLQYMVEIWRDIYQNTPEKNGDARASNCRPSSPPYSTTARKAGRPTRALESTSRGTNNSPAACWIFPTSSLMSFAIAKKTCTGRPM